MVCAAAVEDPHLGEADADHCDSAADEVDGVNGAFGVVVEVPAEDC